MEIAARAVAALLMIAMPLAVGAYLIRRYRTGWGLFLVGAVTFIGSQILHIPFNAYVLNPFLASVGFGSETGPGLTLALAAALLGLSAGVFEEGARWLAYQFWIRKARTWPQGVVFGSGHGGAEALITGLLALATLIQLLALQGQDLAAVVPPEQLAAAQVQVEAYWSLPGWTAFLATVERASALTIQITLAVIVLQAFLRPRGWLWFLAAVGWHALVDAVAVFSGIATGVYGGSISGMLITEAIVALMAGISLVILSRLKPAVAPEPATPPAPPPHAGPLPGASENQTNLDASRFAIKDEAHMIETHELTRRFGDVLAVDRLTLTVHPGEIFGFLGPNGAGKTTTIRMLAALIEPTSGEATVAGYRLGKEDSRLRAKVGFLTETPGLYDRLSAEANLAYFAHLYDVADVAGRVEHYLRWLGLWDQRFEPAGTLSKGMRQKLAIARALLHDPPIVFLDEPTSALDPEAAHLVRDFIAGLRREGRTIVLCTHNLDEADRLCDRVAVFKQRLLALDAPATLRSQLFGRTVVFHLKQAHPAHVALLERFTFVKSARMVDGRLLATVQQPEAENPVLVKALVEAGAEIQFVGELRQTLEDVYLRLVSGPTHDAVGAQHAVPLPDQKD